MGLRKIRSCNLLSQAFLADARNAGDDLAATWAKVDRRLEGTFCLQRWIRAGMRKRDRLCTRQGDIAGIQLI